MSEPFNPFVQWLGMPGGAPSNYYALLQLPAFENDPAVIAAAVQRLRAYLQTVDPGPHAAERQAVLDQISAAEQWLLNPGLKCQYDAVLTGVMATSAAPPPSPSQSPQAVAAPPVAAPPVWENGAMGTESPYAEAPVVNLRLSSRLRGKKRRNPMVLVFLLFVIIGGLAVPGVILYKQGRLSDLLLQLTGNPPSADKSVADAGNSASQKKHPKADAAEATTTPDTPSQESSPFAALSKQASTEPSTPEEKREQERQNQLKESLRQAYLAMAERKLPEVEGHLKTARENILNDNERNQLVRAENVLNSLAEFWRLINEQIKAIKPSDELAVADTRVVVAEVDAQSLTIKADGEPHRYSIDALPVWAIKAIADGTLAKDPSTKALYATFLAVHPKGDRSLANRLFVEVARSGQDIRDIQPDPEFLPSAP